MERGLRAQGPAVAAALAADPWRGIAVRVDSDHLGPLPLALVHREVLLHPRLLHAVQCLDIHRAAAPATGARDFQQIQQPLAAPPASSAWPGCWSSGIFAFPQAVHHLSGSRKRAKETLVPRMFTSLPSTSVNLKFSVLRAWWSCAARRPFGPS